MIEKYRRTAAALMIACALQGSAQAAESQEERKLSELRNTVINLLQSLVQKGVLTKEQAEAMVKSAQEKAAADAAASAAAAQKQEEEEANAIRVPHVPQIVKDEIRKEVVQEITPEMKQAVADQITTKGSLFSALPDWVQRMHWSGSVRVREEIDAFDQNNIVGFYPDYNQINAKGGLNQAGALEFLNTTEDQKRLRLRLLFGFDTNLGGGWSTALRLATGSIGEVLATTNQTLGTYSQGYTITADVGYIRWTGESSTERNIFTATAGRFENPWLSTDLLWYNDLTFEGVYGNYRFNLGSDPARRKDLYATFGAFPLSSFSPFDPNASNQQKWLYAAQAGFDFRTENDSRIQFGAAYYDYSHIDGIANTAPNQTNFNWTAPAFVQKANTLFNIANSPNNTNQLFALASDFRIIDLIAVTDFHVLPLYSVGFTAEAVRNVGFNVAEVEARKGSYVPPRNRGYRADFNFGSSNFGPLATWRASLGYRYLQSDAVLDAFNDEDFHLGGTDTKGETYVLDFSFNPHVWLRAKYMAASAIDGPPLNIDVFQLDINSRF